MESPEYNTINEENQYEFILWCNELKPPTINVDKFNIILQINIDKWIFENNITWQYAYGNTLDTLKAQQEIENTIQNTTQETIQQTTQQETTQQQETKQETTQETQETIQKPIDKVKRRELFAKMAEQRQNRHKKK